MCAARISCVACLRYFLRDVRKMELKQTYLHVKKTLASAAIDSADLEARMILTHVTGVSVADLILNPDRAVQDDHMQTINGIVARRVQREPLSKILGEKEFWGLPFTVSADVLDPRPDTETIIEAAIRRFRDNPPQRILDLGTGSGCLIISLLHEFPDAHGVAVDISVDALGIAKTNADKNGVLDRCTFHESDWIESLSAGDADSDTEKYDLIVSNPPYIPNQDIENLSAEVQNHDPILALDGGNDGLNAYKKIIPALNSQMHADGIALLEVGISQAEDVVRIVKDTGLSVRGVHADLGGIPRVVEISFGEK